MLRTERSAGTVIVAACLFIMWSVAPRAQDAPAGVKASPADVGAVKISGAWQLNKALSTAPPEKAAAPPSGNSGGSAGGRGGRGTGGGNNSTSKNNGLSQAQMSLIAALNGEMRDMPDRLAIHATATDAIITFADGAMRKLTTDGKKQRMTLGAVEVETITTWAGEVLNVELIAGQMTLIETYQVPGDDAHLVVAVKMQMGSDAGESGHPTEPIKHVYDHVK